MTYGNSVATLAATREAPIIFDTESIARICNRQITVTFRAIQPQPDRLNPKTGRPERRIDAPGDYYEPITFPWGGAGTQLWVREAGFQERYGSGWKYLNQIDELPAADQWRRVSPIHMHRARARVILRLLSHRAMRLHAITDNDARQAGVTDANIKTVKASIKDGRIVRHDHTGAIAGTTDVAQLLAEIWPGATPKRIGPKETFAFLWHVQNRRKNRGWDRNLFVWRLEFEPDPNCTGCS